MKKMSLILVLCTLLVLATGCGGDSQTATGDSPDSGGTYTAEWKFAHNESERGTMQIYAEKFKELVEEKSDGNITVSIYPDGTLGSGDSIIELLQGGGLEFAVADSGYIGSFVPESQLFRVHFLLSDDPAVNRQLLRGDAIQMLNEKFSEVGMDVMQHFQAGAVYWTGNKAFHTVDDFKNVTIRTVPTPVLISIYESYGAAPTTINYSEMYSALQLGVADAQENPVNSVQELSLWDVQSTLTLSGHYTFIDTCVVNSSFYANLPSDVKAMLDEVFTELDEYIEGAIKEFEDGILQDIRDNNRMEVVELTAEEKEAFRTFNENNREILRSSLGDSGMEILYAIEAEKAELMG